MTVSTGNLLPANPEILDGADDLIQLSYLNEPAVLYNLQYRYSRDKIYVSTCIFIGAGSACIVHFDLFFCLIILE